MEAPAASILQFQNISLGGKVAGSSGIMKINASGIGWKSKAGKSVAIMGTDLVKAEWIPIGKSFQLKLTVKGGSNFKFNGFQQANHNELKSFFDANFKLDLTRLEYNTSGRNWGDIDVRGPGMMFQVGDGPAFEVPFTDVAQCVLQKNEVTLEFHQDDTSASVDSESLVELRLYFPPDGDMDADEFHKLVLDKADVVSTTGGGLATFPQIPVLTPRGRYDIEIYPSFLRLHGKTYDYKIMYSSISHIFELPKPDDRHVCFMISLDPPIRQGGTRYPHLVLQFDKAAKIDLQVALKEMEGKLPKESRLEEEMSGKVYKVFRRVVRELTQKKITVPGTYLSHHQAPAVKCSVKANDGYLYPMDRCFIFIHKPPTYIRYSDITVVEFARVSSEKQGDIQGGSRTFDLVVYTKGGNDVQFTGMQRTEFKALVNFIQSKGIKIKRISHMEAGADTSGAEADLVASSGAVDDGSSSEDDDFIAKDEMEPDEEFDEGDAEALEADEVDEVDDTSGRGKRKREEAEAKPKPKGERETQTKKGRGSDMDE